MLCTKQTVLRRFWYATLPVGSRPTEAPHQLNPAS
jgi:hypothetical protein